jgi:hypothetical protein
MNLAIVDRISIPGGGGQRELDYKWLANWSGSWVSNTTYSATNFDKQVLCKYLLN